MPSLAALPDLSDPGVVGFGALIGGFIFYSRAWLAGEDEDAQVRQSVKGSYYGTTIALGLYLLTNVRAAGIL